MFFKNVLNTSTETMPEIKQKPIKKKVNPASKYFNAHPCHLPADKLNSYEIKCSSVRKFLIDITSVRMGDIRARNMYKSYAGLCAEKYRHFKYYPLSIHPFSSVRMWLECFFVITMLISNTSVAIHFSKKEPMRYIFDVHTILISAFDVMYLINITANFFTGYVQGKTHTHVVLNLRQIFFKYLRTWFIVDIASTSCFIPVILETEDIYPHLIMMSTKIIRLFCLMHYLDNVLTVLRVGILKKTLIKNFVLIYSFLTWNIFFLFTVEYLIEGTARPTSPRQCSWLSKAKLWNESEAIRFVYALDTAVGMLRRNVNKNLVDVDACLEIFFMISWLISKLLICHCTLKYIIALLGSESAKAKFYIMTKQVENFMIQRKFPPRIKKKILKFYAIRFQSTYCAETKMLSCVTGQLREDILMHSGRQLVRKIQFLKQLPRSLHLQIGFKLRIVIFIAGDIIFKINSVGDCLYFIDKGTVAIYSESGNEICHLEDGDFFGEIALVMKHRFRTTSAVAVTNCELFRLDKEDFDSSIACYPTVYDSIKKVAIHRFEKTYIMDEHHKAEMKLRGEYRNTSDDLDIDEP